MKKFLSMALAMMLLFASMGVLATGDEAVNPNLVFNADFEPNQEGEEVTGSGEGFITTEGTIVDKTTEGIAVAAGQEGPSGEKCVKLEKNNRLMINQEIVSPNTMYKLAFWYYNTNGFTDSNRQTWPGGNAWIVPNVYGLGIASGANAAKMPGRDSNDPVWIHYEIYFMTAGTSLGFQFTGSGGAGSAVEYYDDVTVTKVSDDAQISFVKATDYATAALNTSYFSPTTKELQLTGAVEGKPTWVYSRVVKNMPVDTFKEATRVMAQYTPKSIKETTTLIAAVYDNAKNLKNVYYKECTFEAKPDNETTIDHYVLEPTTTYLDIPETDYAPGNYIKAFMWSSASGMTPISDVVTLPAASATPAE